MMGLARAGRRRVPGDRRSKRCDRAPQVHIALSRDPTEMRVTWATEGAK